MGKNRTVVTVVLFGMTIVLLGATIYISTLLNDENNAPTQIKKTKASAQTYNKTVNLQDSFDEFGDEKSPSPDTEPSTTPTSAPLATPTTIPTLIAKAPAVEPTTAPTITSTPTPTLQPLLAYKSTTISQSPTLIPIAETGGQKEEIKPPTPTKKAVPTIVSNLPEAGWIQTSTILFIVATTTILFSLLF